MKAARTLFLVADDFLAARAAASEARAGLSAILEPFDHLTVGGGKKDHMPFFETYYRGVEMRKD